MCNDRVLTQFDIFLLFIIKTNVFDFDWRAILYQTKLDDKKRFITFKNKTFTFVERNYVTHERELLIIKKNFRKWRCYVKNETIILVRTNHADLQHLKITIKSSSRFVKWFAKFDEYKLDIRYKSNSQMIVFDALNRRNDYKFRIFETDFRTITFDETVMIYARDESFFDETKWDNELKKYENQLKLKDERFYHRDSFNDI